LIGSKQLAGRVPSGARPLLLAALAGSTALAEVSIAIVPPYIEKVARPGSHLSDTLSYTNQGDHPVLVEIDLADFAVGEGGEVAEAPPGTDPTSLASRLHVSPTSIRVVPGQRVYFRYSIEAPDEFSQLRSMIFLSSHPELPDGANQVQVVARMGVPLYVESTDSEPARLEVGEIHWDRPEGSLDRIRVRAVVVNHGQRNIRPEGFVHVDSADGKFSTTFEFNEGREPVLPGQKRRWEQTFGPVPTGEVAVRLRVATSARTSHESTSTVAAAR
jgi:hypothetical protein